ncbi:MAG: hypothetical protein V4444_09405 [Pseudomonadota bacterium]
MAIFCEALADTAVVAEACDQAGMGPSGAYALRRRNSFFAAAWDAALTIARERLADTLLARSIEGNVEQIWRDGALVGERHVIDNRLGLAILRRLDRLAETGLSVSSRGDRAPAAPAPRPEPVDWELMVDALRSGDPEAVAAALALLKSNKVDEVEGPPDSLIDEEDEDEDEDEPRFIDHSDRCWRDPIEGNSWMTDFPPPPGFTAYESCDYGDPDEKYERLCTPEEAAILEADAAAVIEAERAEDAEVRDAWFAMLEEQAAG